MVGGSWGEAVGEGQDAGVGMGEKIHATAEILRR